MDEQNNQQPDMSQQAPEQPSQPAGGEEQGGARVEHHKLWAILGYILPFLFFIPLISEESKHDPFARFHANQQLLVLIVWIVGWVLMFVFIGILVYLFAVVLLIMGIVNAANGHMKKLPLIGGITLIK